MPVFDLEDTLGNDPQIDLDIHNNRSILALFNAGALVYEMLSDGFQYSTAGWKYRYASLCLGDLAADSNAVKFPLLRLPFDVTIESVSIGVDTTAALNATVYQTLSLYNSRSTTAISSLSNQAAAFTLHIPRDFASLDSTLKVIKAGETLYLGCTKTGAGTALSGVVVTVAFSINRSIAACDDYTDNLFRLIAGGGGTDGVIEVDHTSRQPFRIKNRGVEKFRVNLAGKMFGSAPDQYHVAVVNVGDIVDADGAAKKSPLLKPDTDIEVKKIYFGNTGAALADSDSAYTEVDVKDGSGNLLCSGFVNGPYGAGTAMTAGLLYDMGEINQDNAVIASTEQLQVEYVCPGSAPTIPGLTLVIVYKKLA